MFLTSHADSLRSDLRARLPKVLPRRLGIAVSGGGDSVALMHLLNEIAQADGIELRVATVDHGLRAASADEAQTVARQAQRLGISHDTLRWQDWDQTGNLQDQARQARYSLLTKWARDQDVAAIALGHTADDQAETVLMRLARAAGVTGLSAMSATRSQGGVQLLRPLLDVTRQRLRNYLTEIDVGWIEDPSNQDMRFDRIKARKALQDLEPAGITPEVLTRVAENLAQAREALAVYAQESARKIASVNDGDVVLDRAGFGALPDEIQRRILVGAVLWISGAGYPPRRTTVAQALKAVRSGQAGSIGGCLVVPQGNKAWICREFGAIEGLSAPLGERWDGRWVFSGPKVETAEIRGLGEGGLLQLPDWRVTGRPRLALKSSPSIWQGTDLLAAPLAGHSNGWRAELASDWPEFHTLLLSH
ncbi:tRNA lysidine(34) synthetase TilS [uncultured Ruegeria sp.]|uniref:tRNA lysidine(34) synthetase TilS n=1 Tax=uncultured Ruegeria sp. TaxID=259304 RepID=UPI00343C7C24